MIINRPERVSLARTLAFKDAYFLVIGSVFGTGIFFTSGIMATSCPSVPYLLAVWLCGGVIALLGAVTFAELGTMYPGAGGAYVYLRESYGRLAAFLYGWGFFWIVGCGGIAALGAGFAESMRPFLPAAASAEPLLRLPLGVSIAPSQLTATAAIAAVSALNLRGVRTGAGVQNALVIVRLIGLIIFIGIGLAIAVKASPAATASFRRLAQGEPVTLVGLGGAFLAVLWTYDGWYSASCEAEEIRRPQAVLPAALGLGVFTLTLLYVLTNVVYSAVLPLSEMKGVVGIGEAAAKRLLPPSTAFLFAGMISVSALGCLAANVLFCSRVPFAMARDGLFWKRMARIQPSTRVPAAALTLQMIVSVGLALTGRFQALYEFVVFALTLFFAATAIGMIILRRTRPYLPRSYRVPGYPVVPALFAAVNAAVFVVSAAARPVQASMAAGVMALGLPAYSLWRKRRDRDDADSGFSGVSS